MKANLTMENTREGQKLTIEITTPYIDLKCFEFPEHCNKCPAGFSCSGKCGRNVPFLPEDKVKRPDTCNLELINIKEVINNILETYYDKTR